MKRTLTITITAAQYDLLMSACDYYETILEDEHKMSQVRCLVRAWDVIRDAWHTNGDATTISGVTQ